MTASPSLTAPTPALVLADTALLRAAIDWSGKTAQRFTREELVRDDRTGRRWLAGAAVPSGSPLPALVRNQLELWLLDPPAHWTNVPGDRERDLAAREAAQGR